MDFLQGLARSCMQFVDRPGFQWKKWIACFYAGQFVFESFLSLRQYKYLQRTKPPKALEGEVSAEVFDKSQKYSRAKAKFGAVSSIISVLQEGAVLYWDLLPKLWGFTGLMVAKYSTPRFSGEISHTLIFFFVFQIINATLSLPLSYYQTFVLEEEFGFNKQTVKLWVQDLIKGQALMVAFGAPILSAFLKIVQKTGNWFFLYLWLFSIGVQVFAITIYPIVILPLFNKLTPLEAGDLKTGVEKLATRLNFPLKELYVIDGSKRSAHSNAYFYGLPWKKHIVIYDTLIEKSKEDPEEVVAVLGHELGHWSLNHTGKLFMISQAHIFYIFAIFSLFINNKSLYNSFGFHKEFPIIIGFLLFSDAIGPMDLVVKYLMNVLSRKYEFQADEFAVSLGYSTELAKSLIKLQIQNLSTMDADPLYAAYHYSHPILPERLGALRWDSSEKSAKKPEDSRVPIKAADREL